jgi:hypothetical protein
MCIEGGSNSLRGNVSGEKLGWRRKKVTWHWLVGPTRQRGEREIKDTGSGNLLDGPRADSSYWAEGFPGSISKFYFVFFLFFFCFLFLS